MKITTLETLRGRAGLTQRELAHSSGVCMDTISKLESGKRVNSHPTTAKKLAAALEVELSALTGQLTCACSNANGDVMEPDGKDTPGKDGVAKRIELFQIGKELADNRLDLLLGLARELTVKGDPQEDVELPGGRR